jgi:hypothetical protein
MFCKRPYARKTRHFLHNADITEFCNVLYGCYFKRRVTLSSKFCVCLAFVKLVFLLQITYLLLLPINIMPAKARYWKQGVKIYFPLLLKWPVDRQRTLRCVRGLKKYITLFKQRFKTTQQFEFYMLKLKNPHFNIYAVSFHRVKCAKAQGWYFVVFNLHGEACRHCKLSILFKTNKVINMPNHRIFNKKYEAQLWCLSNGLVYKVRLARTIN